MNISPKSNVNNIKPESTKLTRDIFQAEYSQKKKFNVRKTLTKKEDEIRRFILAQTPILGDIPSIDRIMNSFNHISKQEMETILDRLDQMDYIHLNSEKTAIESSYPFSGTETSHIVTINKEGYKKVFAMCAIDALGISFMMDCDVSIVSKCYHCDDKVEIEIKNNEIVSLEPKDVVVWFDQEYSCCAATSCCPYTNFFSSQPHFDKWQEGKIKRKGDILQIQEAFYLGKMIFEDRMEKKILRSLIHP
jgi:hypothetical protein